jgi:hypothetical protein
MEEIVVPYATIHKIKIQLDEQYYISLEEYIKYLIRGELENEK